MSAGRHCHSGGMSCRSSVAGRVCRQPTAGRRSRHRTDIRCLAREPDTEPPSGTTTRRSARDVPVQVDPPRPLVVSRVGGRGRSVDQPPRTTRRHCGGGIPPVTGRSGLPLESPNVAVVGRQRVERGPPTVTGPPTKDGVDPAAHRIENEWSSHSLAPRAVTRHTSPRTSRQPHQGRASRIGVRSLRLDRPSDVPRARGLRRLTIDVVAGIGRSFVVGRSSWSWHVGRRDGPASS